MVNIKKENNSVIFEFTDSEHYLQGDGTISCPLNSLMMVVDESNMVDIKKVSNYDNLCSVLLDNLTISGTQANKSNVIDLFNSVAFASTGGGGESGIPEAPNDNKLYGRKNEAWAEVPADKVTSVNTKTGDVVITLNELGGASSTEVNGLKTSKLDKSVYDTDKPTFALKTDVNTSFEGKQDTLVSGTNIKTINGNNVLGSGNIEIQSGSEYKAGDGITIDSGNTISTSTQIPTLQVEPSGSTNNYIYSAGIYYHPNNVISLIVTDQYNDECSIIWKNWGDGSFPKENKSVFKNATKTTAGMMSIADKTKLDNITINSVPITQAEYDALATKNENTLYLITA